MDIFQSLNRFTFHFTCVVIRCEHVYSYLIVKFKCQKLKNHRHQPPSVCSQTMRLSVAFLVFLLVRVGKTFHTDIISIFS